jgi:hypothetical protein
VGHRPRVDRQGVAKLGDGVVPARSGRPSRDLEELGDLDEGQPEVVVQHEDRALFDREPAEGPPQFVAVDDGVGSVGSAGPSAGRTRTLAVQ